MCAAGGAGGATVAGGVRVPARERREKARAHRRCGAGKTGEGAGVMARVSVARRAAVLRKYGILNTMEIHKTADTGVTLKFSGGTVAVNPPEKGKKSLHANVILTTYPVPIPGWSAAYDADEGQKLFTAAGEYEKDGLLIQGYGTETEIQGKPIQTTTWRVSGEGITVLIPGAFGDKKDAQHIITDNTDTDVIIMLCPDTEEKRPSAAEMAGIAASLQAGRVVLIGADTARKKEIAKNIGTTEEVTDRCVLKRKDVADPPRRAILFG